MPVCFSTPKYLVNTVPSYVHETEGRMYDIIDAIEAGDLLRIRQLIYFGDRTQNEINIDEEFVIFESMNLNKFDFLVAFLAQTGDINTIPIMNEKLGI